MEATFMNSICRSANLRAILDDHRVAETVMDLIQLFQEVSKEDVRGTHLSDLMDRNESSLLPLNQAYKESALTETTHSLLVAFLNLVHRKAIYSSTKSGGGIYLNRTAAWIKKITIRGVAYATSRAVLRDSRIIYHQ